jgi:hypothetical protein
MITIKNNKIVYVDIDDTLINHFIGIPFDEKEHVNLNNGQIQSYKITRNEPNIRAVKHYKQLGFVVVLWSLGGWEHCVAVAKALNIEDFIDVCMSKPDCFIDDKDASVWLNGKRRFYE